MASYTRQVETERESLIWVPWQDQDPNWNGFTSLFYGLQQMHSLASLDEVLNRMAPVGLTEQSSEAARRRVQSYEEELRQKQAADAELDRNFGTLRLKLCSGSWGISQPEGGDERSWVPYMQPHMDLDHNLLELVGYPMLRLLLRSSAQPVNQPVELTQHERHICMAWREEMRKKDQIITSMTNSVALMDELEEHHKTSGAFAHNNPYKLLIREATILTQKDLNADRRLITAMERNMWMPLTDILRHREGYSIYEMKVAFRNFTKVMHELRLRFNEGGAVSYIWSRVLAARARGQEAEVTDYCRAYFDEGLRRSALRLRYQERTEQMSVPSIRTITNTASGEHQKRIRTSLSTTAQMTMVTSNWDQKRLPGSGVNRQEVQ